MGVTFGASTRATITPHDASALALLLDAIGEPAGITAAAKLRAHAQNAPDGDVPLRAHENAALVEAIRSLRGAALPERILKLETALH